MVLETWFPIIILERTLLLILMNWRFTKEMQEKVDKQFSLILVSQYFSNIKFILLGS